MERFEEGNTLQRHLRSFKINSKLIEDLEFTDSKLGLSVGVEIGGKTGRVESAKAELISALYKLLVYGSGEMDCNNHKKRRTKQPVDEGRPEDYHLLNPLATSPSALNPTYVFSHSPDCHSKPGILLTKSDSLSPKTRNEQTS